jgi:hypothetical protein
MSLKARTYLPAPTCFDRQIGVRNARALGEDL